MGSDTTDQHDRDRSAGRDAGATAAAERRRAVVLAGHRGQVGPATAALTDPDPAVRGAALGALERIGVLGDETVRAALRDPEAPVRRRAALAAAGRGDVLADLADLLEDPDHGVAEVAAFACGEAGDAPEGVVERLCAVATGHPDHLCREAAVAALGSLGDPAGLPAVLAGCEDRHTVRRRAVLALAAFDGAEARAALRRLTDDRDLQVRQAAEELLEIEEGRGIGG